MCCLRDNNSWRWRGPLKGATLSAKERNGIHLTKLAYNIIAHAFRTIAPTFGIRTNNNAKVDLMTFSCFSFSAFLISI